jgi:ABC-type transporter Mla subunit MlaD
MTDQAMHLKLDRLLAGQESILARQTDHDAAVGALTAGLTLLQEAIDTQTETLDRLAQAMSAEEAPGEMRDLIISLSMSLRQIEGSTERMVTLLDDLPETLARATRDTVRMAMGNGVDIPPPAAGA